MTTYSLSNGYSVHLFGSGAIISNGLTVYRLNQLQLQTLLSILDGKCENEHLPYRTVLEKAGIISDSLSDVCAKITGVSGKYYPLGICIELTNSCNLECKHCYKFASPERKEYISMAVIDYVCHNLGGKVKNVLLTGGEPTLHPQFDRIVSDLSRFFNVRLFTNGVLIPRIPESTLRKLDYLRVSLYGRNETSFKEYTGKNCYFETYAGLKRLMSLGIKYEVVIIADDSTIDEMSEYLDHISRYGPFKIKILVPMRIGRGSLITLDVERIRSNLSSLANMYPTVEVEDESIRNRTCTAGWQSLCISQNGKIRPCQTLSEELFNSYHYNELDRYAENEHRMEDFVVNQLTGISDSNVNYLCPYMLRILRKHDSS